MGLKKALPCRTYLSINLSADWPIRIFYGLITAYQGLFGLFVPTSIFNEAMKECTSAVLLIVILLITGLLLVADGFMAMIRYCTSLNCQSLMPIMSVFNRRRPWLFLPPAFCYYATLVLLDPEPTASNAVIAVYYITLGFAGVVFCLRDGKIGQRTRNNNA